VTLAYPVRVSSGLACAKRPSPRRSPFPSGLSDQGPAPIQNVDGGVLAPSPFPAVQLSQLATHTSRPVGQRFSGLPGAYPGLRHLALLALDVGVQIGHVRLLVDLTVTVRGLSHVAVHAPFAVIRRWFQLCGRHGIRNVCGPLRADDPFLPSASARSWLRSQGTDNGGPAPAALPYPGHVQPIAVHPHIVRDGEAVGLCAHA